VVINKSGHKIARTHYRLGTYNPFFARGIKAMIISLRSLSLAACALVLLAAAPLVHAATISGSVWEGGTTSSVPALGSSIYGTTPTATFNLTNASATALINFRSNDDLSLTAFLTTGVGNVANGDTLLFTSGASHATDGINNDLFEFQGTTTLTAGTYSFSHDDGMLLYLGSSLVVNVPGPTSAVSTPFVVCTVSGSGCDAVAGTYSYTLLYAEVSGAPAQLTASLPLVTTTGAVPEPSTFIMLGTGLVGAAGTLRRRFRS
jgi:hypothetical protein